MNCKKVKEEFVLLFRHNELGQSLTLAIRRHAHICPNCRRKAEHTRKIVTIVRERCVRSPAPSDLRERILDGLRRSQN